MKRINQTITYKYGIIFIITGIIIYIYSKIEFKGIENIDLGKRFNNSGFYESDLFSAIGIIQVLFGILYMFIHFKASFNLIDKATIRHFWFTILLLLMIVFTPILNKYYPSEKYGDSILFTVIKIYTIISTFLFFIGIYYFVYNFIKSIYAYYLIKKEWK